MSDNLDFRIRTDIYAYEDEVMESLFTEVIRPHERNVIVGIIYRPPNQNVNDFVIRMNDVLGKISRENKICYLMGDFNLNLLNNQNHNATVKFLDDLYSHLFFPLITLPFRITSHTATLIDNIFSNHEPFFKSGNKSSLQRLQTYFSSTLLFKALGANNLQPYHKLSQWLQCPL